MWLHYTDCIYETSSIIKLLFIHYCMIFRARVSIIKVSRDRHAAKGRHRSKPASPLVFPLLLAWRYAAQSVFCVTCAIASVSRPPRVQTMMRVIFAVSLRLDAFRLRTPGLNFSNSRFKSISFSSDCLHV